jgi:predicted metal-dependent HD superfamily phosphohydrolase
LKIGSPAAYSPESQKRPHAKERDRMFRANFKLSAVIEIMHRYGEQHRRYHTLNHVRAMFDLAAARNIALTDAHSLAIIMHDIVYDIPSQPISNERASVSLMIKMHDNEDIQFPCEDIEKASDYIIDTEFALKGIQDSIKDWTVAGLDLYSLGTPMYWPYGALVKNEFVGVLGNAKWIEGRKKFLAFMIEQPYIIGRDFFFTDNEYEVWHECARCNMTDEMSIVSTI